MMGAWPQLRTISLLLTVKVCGGPFCTVNMLLTVKVCGPFFRSKNNFAVRLPVFPLVKDDLRYLWVPDEKKFRITASSSETQFSCLVFAIHSSQLITVNRKTSVCKKELKQFCRKRSAIKILVQQPFVVEMWLEYVCQIYNRTP